jgi:hypothetical protein
VVLDQPVTLLRLVAGDEAGQVLEVVVVGVVVVIKLVVVVGVVVTISEVVVVKVVVIT